MFKKSAIASAILAASLSQISFAQNDQIEEVLVTGIRGSLLKGIEIKRNSKEIVEAIVSEDIGKFPDKNVIESLQRVTGVQTTSRGGGEVSGISIRGLNDIHTTINGRDVFTGAGRSMELQDVPSSLLSSVNVYKNRSANQVERGIAGSIDIKTYRPFDFTESKVVLAADATYSDQPDKTDPNISGLYSNRWDLSGGGEIGALVNVSYYEKHFRDDTLTAGAVFPFFSNNPHSSAAPYSMIPNAYGGADVWQAGLDNGIPYTAGSTLPIDGADYDYLLMRDAIFGTVFTGKRERPAATVSVQWAPNDDLEVTGDILYTGYREGNQNTMWFSNTLEHQSGNINIPVVYDGTVVVKEHQGRDNGGFQSGAYETRKTDSYLYAINSKWTPTDNITVNSDLAYQTSKFSTNFFAMRFERTAYGLDVDYNDKDGLPSIQFWDNPSTVQNESEMSDARNWNASGMWDNGGGAKGDSVTFFTDLDWDLNGQFLQKIKVGGRVEKRGAEDFTRGQESWATGGRTLPQLLDALVAAGAAGDGSGLINTATNYFDGRANIFDNFIAADGKYLIANADAVREVYGLEKEGTTKTFDVTEESYALYALAEFKLGDSITGDIGFRYVNYKQDMEFWAETGVNTNVYDHNSGASKSDKVLPSAKIAWNITDDVTARASYTETLRMPGFGDLNPLQYFQDPLTSTPYGTGNGGNPNLKPVESSNYDFSLEWYFAEGSSLYGAVFRRDIEGFFSGGKKTIIREGNDGVTRPYVLTTTVNATDGELSGYELGLVYFPTELPGLLDGLGVQASYTALDSDLKTPEFDGEGNVSGWNKSNLNMVSDSSYSVSLAYDRNNYGGRLSYTWREKFYSGLEAAIFANPRQFWSRPEQSLDLSAYYDFTDDLSINISATNLLDDVFQSYYGEGNQNLFNFGNAIYSKSYSLGIRYKY